MTKLTKNLTAVLTAVGVFAAGHSVKLSQSQSAHINHDKQREADDHRQSERFQGINNTVQHPNGNVVIIYLER